MAVATLAVAAIGAVSQVDARRRLTSGEKAGVNTVTVTDVAGAVTDHAMVTATATIRLGFFAGPRRVAFQIRFDDVDAAGRLVASTTRDGATAAGTNSVLPITDTAPVECAGVPATVIVSVNVSAPVAAESDRVPVGPVSC